VTFGPITKPARSRKIVTYDLEWVPGDYSVEKGDPPGWVSMALRLVGVYEPRRGYRHYTSVKDFLNGEMNAENDGAWFYAHFGGMADIQYIFDYLVKNQKPEITVSASFSGASAIVVKVQKGGRTWWFVDSFWLIRDKLRNIAKWVGLEKLGADGDRSTFFGSMIELREYNERDCVILYQAIRVFEEYLLSIGGQLERTVASCAMGLFRRRYLRREIRTNPEVNVAARKAYIASRVEVFARECQEANYYDVNSSFPYAMTFSAPGDFTRRTERLPDPDRALYLAELSVSVPHQEIPPLPYRSPRGRIYFPTGEWRAWFCETDVATLLEHGGRVEAVHEVMLFDPFDDLAGYANDLYEKRRKATTVAEKQVMKLLLNSCYGKFGERPEKDQCLINPERTTCNHTPPHPENECMTMIRPGVWLCQEIEEPPHAHVPIAVHITSIARRVLTTHLRRSAEQGEPVYYCDTDGFATTGTHPTSDALGALKLEKRVHEGQFVAPKLYKMKVTMEGETEARWMVKSKGFSRLSPTEFEGLVTARDMRRSGPGEGVSYDDFAADLETKEIAIHRMARLKENLLAGDTTPREISVTKRLRGVLRDKRKHYADGSSRAWSVAEVCDD
jgi:hypothetical protein